MSYSYKLKITKTILNHLRSKINTSLENTLANIKLQSDTDTNNISFLYRLSPNNVSNCDDILSYKDEAIRAVQLTDKGISFTVDTEKYLQHALNYSTDCSAVKSLKKPSKIVIDFSSPNIAKPFHFGHLRSTIIGNFISNISKHLGDDVVKINYLGDWGVQFGFLQYGLDECKISIDKSTENPLKVLNQAYVSANNIAEKQPEVEEQAKEIFRRMEFAKEEDDNLKKWTLIKTCTVNEISKIYHRLGVHFDKYDWESDYSAKRIESLINELIQKNILVKEDNALVAKTSDGSVPFLKSDGTTLYLSRDVAAVLDRYKRYNFDRMLYVVDNSQAKHFRTLINLVNVIDSECAGKMEHVKFGRVIGMSSRKGTTIFLDDILNEIREMMELKRIQSITTKGEIGGEIADILGISIIIVNDLKKRRVANYEFIWDDVLQMVGKCGSKLHYSHCRLFSLEENSGAKLPNQCDPSVFKEPEAIKLIVQMSRFEEAILKSYKELESAVLLQYLFELCDVINKAHKVLRIKGENEHLASQRLLMFHRARLTLNTGMKIIGIKPLNQM